MTKLFPTAPEGAYELTDPEGKSTDWMGIVLVEKWGPGLHTCFLPLDNTGAIYAREPDPQYADWTTKWAWRKISKVQWQVLARANDPKEDDDIHCTCDHCKEHGQMKIYD